MNQPDLKLMCRGLVIVTRMQIRSKPKIQFAGRALSWKAKKQVFLKTSTANDEHIYILRQYCTAGTMVDPACAAFSSAIISQNKVAIIIGNSRTALKML